MRESTLEKLAPLLNFLRAYDLLDEIHGPKFLLKGKDFIHFHDDLDGLWADAKLSKGRIRMSVATQSEQIELMERIAAKLDAFDSSMRKSRQGKRKSRVA